MHKSGPKRRYRRTCAAALLRPSHPLHLPAWLACLLLLVSAGCSASRQELSTGHRDPAIRIPLIKKSVQQQDAAALHRLVDDLDNVDPAIRFYAIQALHRRTSRRFDYRYYDSEEQRQGAIARWRQWLAERESGGEAGTDPAVAGGRAPEAGAPQHASGNGN